ncbi:alpha/beta fold hydrolase [Erythrobacter sp. W53]|uniref:alpha/beta fold hydrolase n=1 Tax=Erythrobacter sp. W53 TaxID=3425947 RepID=UPI003D7688CC
MSSRTIRKGYADSVNGQVHFRSCGAGEASLMCLHPAPFSGLTFGTVLPMLAEGRTVIAPDYPAHGGSDPLEGIPTIVSYAQTMLDAFPGKHDLMGFHTGCLVAAEMSLAAPERIGKLIMLDPPGFERETRAELLMENGAPPHFDEDLAALSPFWERAVTRRAAYQSLEERLALFAEMMRGGKRMNEAFHAGFSYPLEDRLPKVRHETAVIATGGPLAEAAKRASELMENAAFIDRADIVGSALDANAQQTASAILEVLISNEI